MKKRVSTVSKVIYHLNAFLMGALFALSLIVGVQINDLNEALERERQQLEEVISIIEPHTFNN